ncbi:MAG: DUF4258 domain-containing protein [Ginsengibacter sp.]
MRKNTVIIIIIIAVFVIIKFLAVPGPANDVYNSSDGSGFRNTDHILLTKHAKCRMECRHITIDEIKEILQNGNENYSKSGEGSTGNKTYALEGFSSEHQHIRVVVALEKNNVVVITCIDLDKEWPCNCN